MNQKLNKLIKDVLAIDAEAASYIELDAPKLKSYKIFDNISLYNLFNWPDAPQPPGYWSDIDEKVFMRAKGQPKDDKIDFTPDAELDEYYRKAKFFNTEDFAVGTDPREDKKLTLLRFKDHTGLEHDLKFDDEDGEAIIFFIETREIWLGKKITRGNDNNA